MIENLAKERNALKSKLIELAQTSQYSRTLIFVNARLQFLGSCDGLPGTAALRNEMSRMRALGAAGYFLALRRREPADGAAKDQVRELRLLGDHLNLPLIEVLRWE